MADTYKCTGNGVRIRSGPSTNHSVMGALYKGDLVNVVGSSGSWYQLDNGGYVSATYLTMVDRAQDPTQTTSPPANTVTSESNAEANAYKQEVDLSELTDVTKYDDYPLEEVSFLTMIDDQREYLNNLESTLKTSTSRGIHGMPYQFLPVVDNRINNRDDSFGRKFAEKIVARMPVLILTPGIPKFMAGFSSSEKEDMIKEFLHLGVNKGDLDSLVSKGGRYYSFQIEYVKYFEYVSDICRHIAYYMGIENEEINGIKLKKFNWYNSIEADLEGLLRYTKCVAFYIDSDKQISESFSNDTTQSSLASSINGLSDMAREAQFLLGTSQYATGIDVGTATDSFLSGENIDKNMQNVEDFVNNIMLGKGNIFSRIINNAQVLVAGGKLVFPEIWSDSSAGGKSYDINIKLTCPDPTPIGLYLDIMVPMVHLICLTAPRAASANGYISPFLVRGFYKGMFNVDMGIITSLSFNKGAEGSWTRDGIPTVVDVSMTIKDLYGNLSISKNDGGKSTIANNICLLDYLANMCGVNLNEVDIARQISLYFGAQSGFSRFRDMVTFKPAASFEQWKDSLMYNIYSGVFR